MSASVQIRLARPDDNDAIWTILKPIIRAGKTYALPRNLTRDKALVYWLASTHQTYVALFDDVILGTYKLGPNQLGGGDHVANCSYMTHPNARGKGLARAMCADSLQAAKSNGFQAIQFNFVIANNAPAIHLWISMGFEIVGRIPNAFNHPKDGMVDVLIMFQKLE